MNQFFIGRIYQNLIQSPFKKNKLKSLCDTVERTEECSCGKQNPYESLQVNSWGFNIVFNSIMKGS